MDAGKLARIFKALSVDTRVTIVQLLKGRVLCVGALSAQLDVTQGAVSQHLRILRDAGLVVSEKRGYYVHYRLNEKTLAEWQGQSDKLLDTKQGVRKDRKGARPCAAVMRRRKAVRSRKT